MPAVCVYKGCSNRGGHFFPKDPVLLRKWVAAVNVNRPGFVPSKHSKLCSAHFLESDYITEGYYTGLPLTRKFLKKDAVPSVVHSFESENPLDDSVQCSDKRSKRKSEEPITDLCVKNNKLVMLIQDPHYGESIAEDDGETEATENSMTLHSEEETVDPLYCEEFGGGGDDEPEHEISVCWVDSGRNNERLDSVPSVFEYDVTSRPSLREVSTKSQSGDDPQDRVYTSEQRDVVIDKLNSVRSDENVRKLLGPKLSKSIESYLHSNGSFSKLEELLEVQSVGPKTVRTLCDKLLGIVAEKQPRSRSSSPTSNPSSPGRRGRSPAHLVSPPLTEEFCLSVNVLGAIIVDVTSVSWALVDSKKKTLVDWKSLPVDTPLLSLRDVVVRASALEKELPDADLFVLEDPNYGSRGGHHFKSHLTCALATSIHTQREAPGGVVKMAFMKNRSVERHFNASVGSETVSLQPFLQDILDQKVAVGRSNLFISQDLIAYYKTLDPTGREQLSRAGLLSISCIDLVLNKRATLDRRRSSESSE